MLVVGLIGILAALLAGLAALPLIGMLEPLLNGLFSTVTHAAAGPLPEDAADLPALALLLGLAIAAGWLFLEEAL